MLRRTHIATVLAAALAGALASGPAIASSTAVELAFGAYKAGFATPDAGAPLRSYTHSTTMPLRDNAAQSIT